MGGGRRRVAFQEAGEGELVVEGGAGPPFVELLAQGAEAQCPFPGLGEPAEAGEREDPDEVAAEPGGGVGRAAPGGVEDVAHHDVRGHRPAGGQGEQSGEGGGVEHEVPGPVGAPARGLLVLGVLGVPGLAGAAFAHVLGGPELSLEDQGHAEGPQGAGPDPAPGLAEDQGLFEAVAGLAEATAAGPGEGHGADEVEGGVGVGAAAAGPGRCAGPVWCASTVRYHRAQPGGLSRATPLVSAARRPGARKSPACRVGDRHRAPAGPVQARSRRYSSDGVRAP
ncbi:hypothetical protein STANM309S_00376 [Streptomyces tanashiensis]